MEKKHKHLIEMLAAIDPAIYLQVGNIAFSFSAAKPPKFGGVVCGG